MPMSFRLSVCDPEGSASRVFQNHEELIRHCQWLLAGHTAVEVEPVLGPTGQAEGVVSLDCGPAFDNLFGDDPVSALSNLGRLDCLSVSIDNCSITIRPSWTSGKSCHESSLPPMELLQFGE